MTLYELSTSSFIVKIWIEENATNARPTAWRGHISHVASGRRHYFEALEGIDEFIIPYLTAMGADFGNRQQPGG